MIFSFFRRFKGRHHRQFLAQCQPLVEAINRTEAGYQALSQEELCAKTQVFKERLAAGAHLEDLLVEAFAAVKNAARRLCGQQLSVCGRELTWNMVHHDVQLIGGIALHRNKIAEMATGEGKTLVATLPLYLNALTGRGAQLVTANDFLVRRDAEWMGYLYRMLGLSVGYIQNQMDHQSRKEAYAADITYGTASEFGFDYLRDNGMAQSAEVQVQRDHYFVIVDEVDSILIDEARTPLIISGPAVQDRPLPFETFKPAVSSLVRLQQDLCSQLISQAQAIFQKEKEGDAAFTEGLACLLKVKRGMPKHKQLLRIFENGKLRKRFEKYELEMLSDFNKEAFFHLKEDLYFEIDEKQHQADLTDKGRRVLCPEDESAFLVPDLPLFFSQLDHRSDLSDAQRQEQRQQAEGHFNQVSEKIHCISQLLRAYCLYERDVAYVVQEGKVVIVDENTGRIMPGRRWSNNLHQAVECKEGVVMEEENKTYATVTIQNYFRMYEKIAGMTGTAETEANEFFDIYKMGVVVIPTHKPCLRQDFNDVVYKTRREKYMAIVAEIQQAHSTGEPILVGTTSVDSSEVLSRMLKRVNVAHKVLNAKYHQQEAEIIAQAGQRGSVTIATNMAGRGTDIKLGDGVADLGGLYVLGTERHESRRIDRQLRGRCARQGDPGRSRFFVSLEDDLMRLFANAGIFSRVLEKTFQEGEQLEHPMLNRSIQRAQQTVERELYATRRRLLQYDDVLNQQRQIIYGLRNEALKAENPNELTFELIEQALLRHIQALPGGEEKLDASHSELEGLVQWVKTHFAVHLEPGSLPLTTRTELRHTILGHLQTAYQTLLDAEPTEAQALRAIERHILVHALDKHWQDHLTHMEELRQSVTLRSYGQKDPLNEYKNDAFVYFQEMVNSVQDDVVRDAFRIKEYLDRSRAAFQLALEAQKAFQQAQLAAQATEQEKKTQTQAGAPQLSLLKPRVQLAPTLVYPEQHAPGRIQLQGPGMEQDEGPQSASGEVGRNEVCPCGSGQKYKKCCGAPR